MTESTRYLPLYVGLVAGLLVAALVPTTGMSGQVLDNTEERLVRIRDRYDNALEEARSELQQACTKEQSVAVAADGRFELDWQAFKDFGLLPASAPNAALDFQRKRQNATKEILRALEGIQTDFRQHSQHERADEVAELASNYEHTYPPPLWDDLRITAELTDREGPTWNGPNLVFDGQSRQAVQLRPRSLKIGDAYRLLLEVERMDGDGSLQLAFPRPDLKRELGLLVLAGFGGDVSGLELVDGHDARKNPTTTKSTVFQAGKPSRIIVECTGTSTSVSVNGGALFSWDKLERQSMPIGLAEELDKHRNSFSVIALKGTKMRLCGAYLVELHPPGSENASHEAADSKPVESAIRLDPDALARGVSWHGTWFDDTGVDIRVVARNRDSKTATIEVDAPRGTWQLDVKTKKDGLEFDVIAIRNTGVKSGGSIDVYKNVSGTGKIRGDRFQVKFKSKSVHKGHTWSTTVNGKR